MEEEVGDSNVFVMKIDGEPGDLHCMTCLKICNYAEGTFCCTKSRNLSLNEKRSESAFLMVCLQRHAIDQMVKALIADKEIVDTNGKCLFCRNNKQHEKDKWCAGRTKVQLYLSRLHKDEAKVDDYLEKYLEIRVDNRMKELKKVHERIEREMREYHTNDGKSEEEIQHILARQGRNARKTERKELMNLEHENEQIRGRLARKLASKKLESIDKIEKSCAPPPPTLEEFIHSQFEPDPDQTPR
ncbi:hypothetical protein CAEBREN_20711 [Caenorhabditis brenneri]|uniref:Uncharacterized protein n=1 Tax=Caenorhabditis brenneri TaxID=135651 RepID=G0MAI5_CAEBE|nr:hypothetical protein CAEBREN_20711 [Caenorhabditis brenneri]